MSRKKSKNQKHMLLCFMRRACNVLPARNASRSDAGGRSNTGRNKGFTLVELLVTGTIFAILIVSIIGVFVSAIRVQRYSLSQQQLLNQTSFAMEYMSRFLRMARKDTGSSCTPNKEIYFAIPGRVEFENYRGICHEFYRSNDIDCSGPSPNGTRLCQNLDGIQLPLTSNDLVVTDFRINVKGARQPPADLLQPRVTLFLRVEGKGINPPILQIQTTVSQRNLDVQED